MSDSLYVVGVAALGLAAVAALTLFQMRRTIAHVAARRLGQAGGALAGIGVGIIAFRALADRLNDSASWVTAIATMAFFLLPLTLANVAAQQATAIADRNTPPAPAMVPEMHLEPGQRVVWSSTMRSKWLLVLAVVVLLIGPFMMFQPDVPPWLLGVVVLAGIACLSLASIRVTADSGGLGVKYGVLPWPATSIALDRIKSASVIDVRPMEWGGWGYRGTLTLMRQAAVVLRAGPGLRIDLSDGRVFIVTVDDPETGMALLNAEIARLPAG